MSWLNESSSESEVENKLTINKDYEKKYWDSILFISYTERKEKQELKRLEEQGIDILDESTSESEDEGDALTYHF